MTTLNSSGARLLVLDGWRAVSILLVLATHMLPIGPKALRLNGATGLAGMSLFFTLSGFLITTNLYKHPSVSGFVIRRLCRILPLAYVATIIYMVVQSKGWPYYLATFLFIVNLDMSHLTPLTGHFWSLCVEVHFYAFIALLMWIVGKQGLRWLPIVALAVTATRVLQGERESIMTQYRVDEILAGALLALVWNGELGRIGRWIAALLVRVPLAIWLLALAISCHDRGGVVMYLRPYFAMAAVGHTLLTKKETWSWLRRPEMHYIAEISYALYVIHPLTMAGWLGSGDTLEKYLKRPICFALTFGLSHLSTFRMERLFIAWGKHLSHRLENRHRSAESNLNG